MVTASKLIPWLTTIVGSYAGWWLGARIEGIFTAFILSIVCGGAGMYLGRRWVVHNL